MTTDTPMDRSGRNRIEVIRTVSSLRAFTQQFRDQRKTIGLVPTMGALHDGHISLVKQAQSENDAVIVSIFVNPKQFGPNEDFDAYPRTWESDLDKLTAAKTDAVYHPAIPEMYNANAATSIHVSGVSEGLCGAERPGHFDGVALVVTKLLLQCLPHKAYFGEKDFQQLQVIKRMTHDLNIPVDICGVPIMRDENGLALSSRNAYLSAEQYRTAIKLNRILFDMADNIKSGKALKTVLENGRQQLEKAGFDAVDYLDICDAETLRPASETNERPMRILTAVKLGKARLIDNVGL